MDTASSDQPRVRRAGWRPIATRLVLVAVAALFVRTWVAQSFSIPSGSMEPTLLAGDFVLVDRFVFGPTLENAEHALLPMRAVRRGDVVVSRLPADPRRHLVKRVVGLPGEALALRGATVYIDGAPLHEPYLPGGLARRSSPTAPLGHRDLRQAQPPRTARSRRTVGPATWRGHRLATIASARSRFRRGTTSCSGTTATSRRTAGSGVPCPTKASRDGWWRPYWSSAPPEVV